MFAAYDEPSIGLLSVSTLPKEEIESPCTKQHWQSFLPPSGFLRPRKRRKLGGLDDDSVVLELAWDTRDVSAPDCPKTKIRLAQRLGLKSAAKKFKTSLSHHTSPFSASSDESPGAILSDSVISDDEKVDMYKDYDREVECLIIRQETYRSTRVNEEIEMEDEVDEDIICSSSVPIKQRLVETGIDGISGKQKKKSFRPKTLGFNKANGPVPFSSSRLKDLPLSSRDTNVSWKPTRPCALPYMSKSPILLVPQVVLRLNSTLLATRQFPDATKSFRLFQKFFKTIPDFRLSDFALEIFQKSLGYPTIIRNDVLFDLLTIYTGRRQIDDCKEYMLKLVQETPLKCPTALGTIHSCLAFTQVAKWLANRLSEKERKVGKANELALDLIRGRDSTDVKRDIDVAIKFTWERKMLPHTKVLRLAALFYADKEIDKMLSIVEDFLPLEPSSLDLLELKVVMLQRRSREWTVKNFLYSFIHKNDDLDALIRTTLYYIDKARGEPQSFTIAAQSFNCFPLKDRLRCCCLFLKSNSCYGPAWRLLVENTLGFLGRKASDKKQISTESALIWQMFDDVLGPDDKLAWHRKFFDAKRSNLLTLKPGDRILVFLMAPFFVSDWDSMIGLGQLISQSFPDRPRLGAYRARSPQFSRLQIKPSTTESAAVLDGFKYLMDFVLGCTPQNGEKDSKISPWGAPNLNMTEILLLTEVSLKLNPPQTISNTTSIASAFWKRHCAYFYPTRRKCCGSIK